MTTSSQQEAETIARAIVESKLAACVNIFPIQSIYTWQEKVHNEPEFQLFIKTDRRLFDKLETKIRELHSLIGAAVVCESVIISQIGD